MELGSALKPPLLTVDSRPSDTTRGRVPTTMPMAITTLPLMRTAIKSAGMKFGDPG
jgi:hypothetical protein